MTKKLLSLAIGCILLATPMCVSAQAPSAENYSEKVVVSEEAVEYENGLTITTTIRVSQPVNNARASSTTVTADKISTGTVSGVEVWSYTITGDFTYNGSTAHASNPSDDYSIFADNWSCSSHSARSSGASITGSATFKSKAGATKSASPKLTCSATGDIR